ncbi:PREDICTED: LOB domain-containing protein 24-like isoform X2 [Nelumbo nucifera]|uniref:LOB domain-containing protein 24-like isoform X2 n=1 Tax=Nelumbo nucifera TaxID=4432 RepID=A0A1U8AS08_NELNU|nr:PREDICTED: LOB domain-containing protein 24-like isoform X2 [Nelumbo nucifera]
MIQYARPVVLPLGHRQCIWNSSLSLSMCFPSLTACKYLRRRCLHDCILAPYFPSTNPERFACVHKIFGASNITKMLQQLPVHQRAVAADCMSFEAGTRVRDPVYGCVAIISQLHQQIIITQRELAETQGQIAFYGAQQVQDLKQKTQSRIQYNETMCFNASQQDSLHLDQSMLDFYRAPGIYWSVR